jgi:flagellar P-ring protein FlgI
MNAPTTRLLTAALLLIASLIATSAHASGLRLGDICRLKGQETNTLQGMGIVVGLRGTGDGDSVATSRMLARYMQQMGGTMSVDQRGQLDLSDVENTKNVAQVFVTVTVPAAGAQPGDLLNATVNAISAKSLVGGTLLLTSLKGPRPGDPVSYANAQGPLNVSIEGAATTATIEGGAKIEVPVLSTYQKDGKITLVLDKDFASFDIAANIEEEINGVSALMLGDGSAGSSDRPQAKAIDQVHVEVMIPERYQANPIKFISFLWNITIPMSSRSSRVVINERDGVVVIGKDVEVAPVLITHRNLRIETGGSKGFVPIGSKKDEPSYTKLKDLADTLNAMDVETEDLISIIKTLKHKGDLFGEVVYQ